jgi:hypothetical protein
MLARACVVALAGAGGLGSVSCQTAGGQPSTSPSWSTVKMAACKPDDPAQAFDVASIDGTGRIRDKETGRCLTLKDCKLGAGIQQSVEVGLQECGEDTCDGQGSQWVAAAATIPGTVIFKSVLKGTTGECYVLNIRNADTLPVVAYGDPECSPNSKNNQFIDPDKGTLHAATGWECGTDCCVTADPCIAPACILPTGWAWPFVLTLLLGGAAYFAGGVAYGVKTNGATVGIGAHPHAAHWEQLGGLCVDGSRWSLAKANELRTHGSASRAKGPGFTPIGDAGEAASTAAAGVGGGASEENAAAEDDSEDDSLVE